MDSLRRGSSYHVIDGEIESVCLVICLKIAQQLGVGVPSSAVPTIPCPREREGALGDNNTERIWWVLFPA